MSNITWKFIDEEPSLVPNTPYWFFGVYENDCSILWFTVQCNVKRGWLTPGGALKTDEISRLSSPSSPKDLHPAGVNVNEIGFRVIAYAENPEGLIGNFIIFPTELADKAQERYDKFISQRAKERENIIQKEVAERTNRQRNLPSLHDKIYPKKKSFLRSIWSEIWD